MAGFPKDRESIEIGHFLSLAGPGSLSPYVVLNKGPDRNVSCGYYHSQPRKSGDCNNCIGYNKIATGRRPAQLFVGSKIATGHSCPFPDLRLFSAFPRERAGWPGLRFCGRKSSYSASFRAFLRFRLRAKAAFTRFFSPGFR